MRIEEDDDVDRWVRRLNRLCREMDRDAEGMGPSAVCRIADLKLKCWLRLAARGPSAFATRRKAKLPSPDPRRVTKSEGGKSTTAT